MKSIIKQFLKGRGYRLSRIVPPAPGTDILHDIKNSAGRREIATVFDIGANVGQSALRFTAVFPKAKVYSFEPVPSTFELLKAQVAQEPRIRCFNLGCAAKTGETTVIRQEYSVWNSLVPEINVPKKDGGELREVVKLETVDRMVKELGIVSIDLLKTDTEGLDLAVLEGTAALLERQAVRFVVVEVGFHEADHRHSKFNMVNDYLVARGFCLAGFYDQMFFPELGHSGYHCDALFMLL